jgi:hypothetical protein
MILNSIDGNILYQTVEPLTKKFSPSFLGIFNKLGGNNVDLFTELKTVLSSNFETKNEEISKFIKKLDAELPKLPTPVQTWFKKFYKTRISDQVKGMVGELKSLDKTFSFDSLNNLMNSSNWHTSNSAPPVGSLDQKNATNMGTVPRHTNKGDLSLLAANTWKMNVCKERAKGALISKLGTPTKSHGQQNVGDYEFPKRIAKVATEYQAKIRNLAGVNGKYVFDNLDFVSNLKNLQTGSPVIKIPNIINGKNVISTVFGPTLKKIEAKNPFLPDFNKRIA